MEIAQGMGAECKTLSSLQWDQALNIQHTRAVHEEGCSSSSALFTRSLRRDDDPAFSFTDSPTIIIVSTVECVSLILPSFSNCQFLSIRKVGCDVEITTF